VTYFEGILRVSGNYTRFFEGVPIGGVLIFGSAKILKYIDKQAFQEKKIRLALKRNGFY
jgi:hypothetical protein